MDAAIPAQGIANANTFLANLNEVECVICDESFSDTHTPVILPSCHHVFGSPCLHAWVLSENRGHNRCPTCRAVLFDDGLPLVEQVEGIRAAAVGAAGPRRGAGTGLLQELPSAAEYRAQFNDIVQPPRITWEPAYEGNPPIVPRPPTGPGHVAQAAPVHYNSPLQQLDRQQAIQRIQMHDVPPGQNIHAYGQTLARNIEARLPGEEQGCALNFDANQPYLPQRLPWFMGRGGVPPANAHPAHTRSSFVAPPPSQLPDRLPYLQDDLPITHYLNLGHAGVIGHPQNSLQDEWPDEWPYQYPTRFPTTDPEYIQLLSEGLVMPNHIDRNIERGEEDH